jgi:hypothetical protein
MPNHTGLGADLLRGLQQAANGAVEGAITASLLYHLYNVLTDSPALRDGQYVMFPLITLMNRKPSSPTRRSHRRDRRLHRRLPIHQREQSFRLMAVRLLCPRHSHDCEAKLEPDRSGGPCSRPGFVNGGARHNEAEAGTATYPLHDHGPESE